MEELYIYVDVDESQMLDMLIKFTTEQPEVNMHIARYADGMYEVGLPARFMM